MHAKVFRRKVYLMSTIHFEIHQIKTMGWINGWIEGCMEGERAQKCRG